MSTTEAIQSYKAKRINLPENLDRNSEYRELGYNADDGKSIVESRDEGTIKTEPVTNGYRAPGRDVSVQRSGNIAQSNSMPKSRSRSLKPKAKPDKFKPIKFLFVLNGKYFVGGYQKKPIEVGKNQFHPRIIENHGGRKFALIGYRSQYDALDYDQGFTEDRDIVIQLWTGAQMTTEAVIPRGSSTGRFLFYGHQLRAGDSIPSPVEYASSISVGQPFEQQWSRERVIRLVTCAKAGSRFGAQSWSPPNTESQRWESSYYTDQVRTIGGGITYERVLVDSTPIANVWQTTLIAEGQKVVLPDRLLPWSNSSQRTDWIYSLAQPLGAPTFEERQLESLVSPVITDLELSQVLCVRSQYRVVANAELGAAETLVNASDSLILVRSGGDDLPISENFKLREMDFLPMPPRQPIDTGGNTAIAAVRLPDPLVTHYWDYNFPEGTSDSLHFLNFAVLQGGRLTIVDPIKNELNTWTLSTNPTKITKKADYYPLPKNAQILGAQWHK